MDILAKKVIIGIAALAISCKETESPEKKVPIPSDVIETIAAVRARCSNAFLRNGEVIEAKAIIDQYDSRIASSMATAPSTSVAIEIAEATTFSVSSEEIVLEFPTGRFAYSLVEVAGPLPILVTTRRTASVAGISVSQDDSIVADSDRNQIELRTHAACSEPGSSFSWSRIPDKDVGSSPPALTVFNWLLEANDNDANYQVQIDSDGTVQVCTGGTCGETFQSSNADIQTALSTVGVDELPVAGDQLPEGYDSYILQRARSRTGP